MVLLMLQQPFAFEIDFIMSSSSGLLGFRLYGVFVIFDMSCCG